MKKFILLSITLFLFSCGGGGGGTPVTISWSKVSNSCISAGGGYKVYYFTAPSDLGSDISPEEINRLREAHGAKTKEVSYSSLTDPNNPSTVIKLKRGVTYFNVSSYCTSGESAKGIYSKFEVN